MTCSYPVLEIGMRGSEEHLARQKMCQIQINIQEEPLITVKQA